MWHMNVSHLHRGVLFAVNAARTHCEVSVKAWTSSVGRNFVHTAVTNALLTKQQLDNIDTVCVVVVQLVVVAAH